MIWSVCIIPTLHSIPLNHSAHNLGFISLWTSYLLWSDLITF